LGIFGYGPDGDKGFLTNIYNLFFGNFLELFDSIAFRVGKLFVDIGAFIVNSINNLLTGLIDLVGLSSFFNMQDGETVFGAFSRGWDQLSQYVRDSFWGLISSITNNVTTVFNNMVNWIKETVDKYNPLPLIEQKIKEMVDFILGIFPSVEEMKKFMSDMIKSIPGAGWLMNKLSSDTEPFATPVPSRDYSKAVEVPPGGQAGVSIFQQIGPQTTNNVSGGAPAQAGRSRGRPSTRPDQSGWDQKALEHPR